MYVNPFEIYIAILVLLIMYLLYYLRMILNMSPYDANIVVSYILSIIIYLDINEEGKYK